MNELTLLQFLIAFFVYSYKGKEARKRELKKVFSRRSMRRFVFLCLSNAWLVSFFHDHCATFTFGL